MGPYIVFDGMQLIGIAFLILIGVLWGLVYLGGILVKLIRGQCITHKPGKLLDVASVGGRAKYSCQKCSESFWK